MGGDDQQLQTGMFSYVAQEERIQSPLTCDDADLPWSTCDQRLLQPEPVIADSDEGSIMPVGVGCFSGKRNRLEFR